MLIRVRQADEFDHHLQMNDVDAAPALSQIFEDQPAMTHLRGGFAAKQHSGRGEERAVELVADVALPHEIQEARFVLRPRSFVLLVVVQHLLGGRQQRLVDILRATDFAEEITQVLAFRKSRQLGNVVEPYVEQTADSGAIQETEELLCRLLSETDGIDFHSAASSSANRAI